MKILTISFSSTNWSQQVVYLSIFHLLTLRTICKDTTTKNCWAYFSYKLFLAHSFLFASVQIEFFTFVSVIFLNCSFVIQFKFSFFRAINFLIWEFPIFPEKLYSYKQQRKKTICCHWSYQWVEGFFIQFTFQEFRLVLANF